MIESAIHNAPSKCSSLADTTRRERQPPASRPDQSHRILSFNAVNTPRKSGYTLSGSVQGTALEHRLKGTSCALPTSIDTSRPNGKLTL